MTDVFYLTKEGFDNLKSELDDLKSRGRRDIARQIAEARDKGDLSENAEYDAAKEAQGLLELKIKKLENKVAGARIISESADGHTEVKLLSKVIIKNLQNNMQFTYNIVPEEEANLAIGKLAVSSPIGKGLLGKHKGDIAEVKAPAGVIKFEIVEIL